MEVTELAKEFDGLALRVPALPYEQLACQPPPDGPVEGSRRGHGTGIQIGHVLVGGANYHTHYGDLLSMRRSLANKKLIIKGGTWGE